MDGDRLLLWVEHDDLEEAASPVSADHQYSIPVLKDQTQGHTHRGADVLVRNGVPTSTVRDVHL
jgi:hypothetical protein